MLVVAAIAITAAGADAQQLNSGVCGGGDPVLPCPSGKRVGCVSGSWACVGRGTTQPAVSAQVAAVLLRLADSNALSFSGALSVSGCGTTGNSNSLGCAVIAQAWLHNGKVISTIKQPITAETASVSSTYPVGNNYGSWQVVLHLLQTSSTGASDQVLGAATIQVLQPLRILPPPTTTQPLPTAGATSGSPGTGLISTSKATTQSGVTPPCCKKLQPIQSPFSAL